MNMAHPPRQGPAAGKRHNLMRILPDDRARRVAATNVNRVSELFEKPGHVTGPANVMGRMVAEPADAAAAAAAPVAIKQVIRCVEPIIEPVKLASQFGMCPAPFGTGRFPDAIISRAKNTEVCARAIVAHGTFETDKHKRSPRSARPFQTRSWEADTGGRPAIRPGAGCYSAFFPREEEHGVSPVQQSACLQGFGSNLQVNSTVRGFADDNGHRQAMRREACEER